MVRSRTVWNFSVNIKIRQKIKLLAFSIAFFQILKMKLIIVVLFFLVWAFAGTEAVTHQCHTWFRNTCKYYGRAAESNLDSVIQDSLNHFQRECGGKQWSSFITLKSACSYWSIYSTFHPILFFSVLFHILNKSWLNIFAHNNVKRVKKLYLFSLTHFCLFRVWCRANQSFP